MSRYMQMSLKRLISQWKNLSNEEKNSYSPVGSKQLPDLLIWNDFWNSSKPALKFSFTVEIFYFPEEVLI